MKTIAENVEIIRDCGYRLTDHFVLPESAWWDDYYGPIESRIELLREKYKADKEALSILDEEEMEIEMYRNYSDSYGYAFFIMKSK